MKEERLIELIKSFENAVQGYNDEQHRGFSWNFAEREQVVEACRKKLIDEVLNG